jgi:hypothetical protein
MRVAQPMKLIPAPPSDKACSKIIILERSNIRIISIREAEAREAKPRNFILPSLLLSCKMPAPVTKNDREMSDRSTSHREERISPSSSTPLALRHVLLSSGFPKQRDQLHPSKRLTLGRLERALLLQRALDLIESSDSWSD